MTAFNRAGNAAGPSPETPVPQGAVRAATAVCRDRGISDVTLWRMGKRGDVRIINIYGRAYVDLESLSEFDRRARAGEFARTPVGAAAKAAQARKAKLAAAALSAANHREQEES